MFVLDFVDNKVCYWVDFWGRGGGLIRGLGVINYYVVYFLKFY